MNSEIEISTKQLEYTKKAIHRWNGKIGATQCGKTYIDTLYVIISRIEERIGKAGLNFIVGVSKETITRNIIEPMQEIFGNKVVTDISSNNTCRILGEKVYCLGADNIGRVSKFRGARAKYIYIDEIVDINREVFELLKSRLSFEYSICDFAGNPQSKNHWFKDFLESNADIYCQHYTIFDNPFLPKDYINELCKEYEGTVYYQRYILGNWANAEGIIFRQIADNKERYITEEKQGGFISVGIDWGGHRSAHTIVASRISRDFTKLQVLASEKLEAENTNTNIIFKWIIKFINEIQKEYGTIEAIFPDCAEQVLNNSLRKELVRNNIYIQVIDSVKTPLEDRIQMIIIMLNLDRISFIKEKTDTIIIALQTAVYDEKAERDIWLDNGTSDIDSLDAFCYSWTKWSNQLSKLIGG